MQSGYIAQNYGPAIIEDTAEAIGSEYRGKCAGSLEDMGFFSLPWLKTMITGEWGYLRLIGRI
jgi:perosamine synthetase